MLRREKSVVKAIGESRGQHLWWQNTFYNLFTFISRNKTVNGLFCLKTRFSSHINYLTRQITTAMAGYFPQWLLHKCTNKLISHLNTKCHRFLFRKQDRFLNLISKPYLVNLHAGYPWLFYLFCKLHKHFLDNCKQWYQRMISVL